MDALILRYYTGLILATRHAKTKGSLGEELVMAMLNARGYSASRQIGKMRGDLRVVDLTSAEVLRVEVKTACANIRGKYQFLLRKKDRYGGTNCGHADFVILLAVTRSGGCSLFVFPSEVLPGRQVTICGNPFLYNGRYSNRRQTFKNLDLRTPVLNSYERVASL